MSRTPLLLTLAALVLCGTSGSNTSASDDADPNASVATRPNHTVSAIKPSYVASEQLLDFLGAEWVGMKRVLEWGAGENYRRVEVRSHDAANILVLSGDSEDVEYATEMLRMLDVPPRQIEVEATIIEVNETRFLDAGIDWQELLETSAPRLTYSDENIENTRETTSPDGDESKQKTVDSRDVLRFDSQLRLDRAIRILDETGAGNVRLAPRILTVNNRPATILDGQRLTYVTRYSAYTDLYETQTMDAGLTLDVRPSLGESGLLTLEIRAEMTLIDGSISGSPIKRGQIVENTVVARDGQPVVLGGFTRNVESKTKRRFPVLGHVLPFLFSREIRRDETIQSFITLAARVVDLDPSPGAIEDPGED